MIQLYQFPLSHYCEKVRWALDYKRIPYKIKNLLPGPHLLTIKKIAPKTTVPVIVDAGQVVQDSTQIISYLDAREPDLSLTPRDPDLALECLEWEKYLHQKVGIHLRRYIYFYALPHTRFVKSLILQDASLLGRGLYFFAFPFIRKIMRKSMKISELGAAESLEILESAIVKLNTHLADKKFLVGDQFSRADLSAAALFSPLCYPPEHDFTWPDTAQMPPQLLEFRKKHENARFFKWVLEIYQNHRH